MNTVNAKIDCEKQTVGVSFGDESHEFNFSKFSRKHHKEELPSKDEIIGLASIVVPPTDPLEQYLLDHENDMHLHERNEIDKKNSLNNVLCLNTICLLKLWEVLLHLKVILCLN